MKVIYESHAKKEATKEEQIDRQMKLLQYMKDGHTVEVLSVHNVWLEKIGTMFQINISTYRVLEKPKEITVYTMICVNSCGKIYSWGTENKKHFDTEVNHLDFVGYKLLKTHVDKVVIS